MPAKKTTDATRSYKWNIYSDVDHLPLSKIHYVLGSTPNIDRYAYILHDKDVRKGEDAGDDEYDTFDESGLCNPHYHLLIHCKNTFTRKRVADLFEIDSKFVRVTKSDVGALAYLTHQMYPNKYQYPVSDVCANFDYSGEIAKHQMMIAKSDAAKAKTNRLDDLIEMVFRGEMRPYNEKNFMSHPEQIAFRKSLDVAYTIANRELIHSTPASPRKVIFITGDSGAAKSTYAELLAKQWGLPFSSSSSSNDPLQDYCGEPCLILDDLRPGKFSYEDFLRLLDPYRYCTCKSRYANKAIFADVVIITSILPVSAFYPFLVGADGSVIENYIGAAKDAGSINNGALETSYQLERRIYSWVQMTADKIDFRFWNDSARCWTNPIVTNNDTKMHIADKTYFRHSFGANNYPSLDMLNDMSLSAVNDDIVAMIGASEQLALFETPVLAATASAAATE